MTVTDEVERRAAFAETLTAVIAECTDVENPTPGQLIAAAARVLVPKIVGVFARYLDPNTQALVAAERVARREEWARTSAENLGRHLAALSAQVDSFEAKLAQRTLDPQFHRLVDNFGLEATREATDERFRMLTHATAGAFNVSMTIAEAARAERTVRELDPEDIIMLRGFSPLAAPHTWMPAFDSLVAAGCLFAGAGAGGGVVYRMTRLGGLVDALTRSYDKRP